MANLLVLSEIFCFGKEAVKNFIEEIKNRRYERILVITNPASMGTAAAKKIPSLLAKNRIVYQIFDRVDSVASVSDVRSASDMAKGFRADAVVAVGSGSVMDVAKAVSLMLANEDIKDPKKFDGKANTKNKSFPLLMVATSVGFARDLGYSFILEDENARKKIVCHDSHALPAAVYIDSEIISQSDSKEYALASYNLIARAIDSIVSKDAWQFTEKYCVDAIKILAENAKNASAGKADAKEQVLYAQYLLSVAVSNSGQSLLTSLAESLDASNGVPASLTSALLLSEVMQINAPATGNKYHDIAVALGAKVAATAKPDVFRKSAVTAIEKLAKDLALPKKIADFTISKEDLDFVSDNVLKFPCTEQNPKTVTKKKIIDLYKGLAK